MGLPCDVIAGEQYVSYRYSICSHKPPFQLFPSLATIAMPHMYAIILNLLIRPPHFRLHAVAEVLLINGFTVTGNGSSRISLRNVDK